MNELLEKLALAKWKEMIHTLGETNQLRLRTPQIQKVKEISSEVKARMQNDKMKDYFGKDYKIHDYEKELVGLERGSDEIVRKISPDTKIVREIEDIDAAAESVAQKHVDIIGTHSKEEVEKNIKNTLLSDHPISSVFGHGGVVRDDIGFISKGNLSRETFEANPLNIDRDWDKYVNNERSLAQRYVDAIAVRHETDELRARIKNRLNRGYIKDRNTGASGNVINLTGTQFVAGVRSNHASPEVLVRESAHIALAPGRVQDAFKNLRLLNDENKLIPNYGISATIDKNQINKVTNRFSKNVEQAIRNTLTSQYGQDRYLIKPIPLGPVKQSSLRTKRLEKYASRRWKELLHTLSKGDRARLLAPQSVKAKEIPREMVARTKKDAPYLAQNYRVHDYERELHGLNKGSDIIAKKQGITFTAKGEQGLPALFYRKYKSLDPADKHMPGPFKALMALKSSSAVSNSGGYFTLAFPDKRKPIINIGNSSKRSFEGNKLNIDKDYSAYRSGKRSLEQKYSDAMSRRHEVDEALILERLKQQGKLKFNELGLITGNPEAYGMHISKEVIKREGINTAIAPPIVRQKRMDMRRSAGEYFSGYGDVASKKSYNSFNRRTSKHD